MSNTIYSLSELLEIANLAFDEVTELKVKSIKGGEESEFVSIPQLTAPTISLSGTTISWSAITNASLYSIYSDGTLETTTSNTSFDLSTLTLEAGTHEIKIKASGNGFLYSNFSNAVSYEDTSPNPYLKFSSPNSFTLKIVDNQKYWDGTLEYSKDTTTWSTWSGTTTLSSGVRGNNNVLYLRGTGNTYITGSSASDTTKKWVLTGSNISCEGNIENLLDYATVALGNHPTMANACYYRMFLNCEALITTPDLSAITLANACYYQMFRGCTSLTTTPSLPATTLATSCYYGMFAGCTSLTTIPGLPATNLIDFCYRQMFRDCTKIKLSETRTGEYQNVYRIPTFGTGSTSSYGIYDLADMFMNTGGTFTGTPAINTTYYTSNTVILAISITPNPNPVGGGSSDD